MRRGYAPRTPYGASKPDDEGLALDRHMYSEPGDPHASPEVSCGASAPECSRLPSPFPSATHGSLFARISTHDRRPATAGRGGHGRTTSGSCAPTRGLVRHANCYRKDEPALPSSPAFREAKARDPLGRGCYPHPRPNYVESSGSGARPGPDDRPASAQRSHAGHIPPEHAGGSPPSTVSLLEAGPRPQPEIRRLWKKRSTPRAHLPLEPLSSLLA